MELTHRFTVPLPVDEAWAQFNDISSVAECFPGAAVTSVEGETFQGTVKVKLGPIALVYTGSGTFTEKDEAAHRMVVDAKGKDKRGNGTAGAAVTLTMTESMADAGANATEIEVLTNLAITGKPAQFGRGVMQDVSDKLLGQFVACLEQRFAGPAAEEGVAPVLEEAGAPAVEEGRQGPSRDPVTDETTRPAAEPEPTLTDESAPAVAETPPANPPPRPAAEASDVRKKDDSLDLGATVVPVLIRSYWRQAVAALVVIVLVIWLIAAL